MKKVFLIIFTFSLTQFIYSQSDEELLKLWNSEVIKLGDRIKSEIDSINLKTIPKDTIVKRKNSNENIKIYSHKESINKMTRTYSKSKNEYIENYYFTGSWIVYFEIKNLKNNKIDKFYFDKSNLILWVDSNKNELTLKNKECQKWWKKIIRSADKLYKLANK